LIRSIIALHNLINNKISNRDSEMEKDGEKTDKDKKDGKDAKDGKIEGGVRWGVHKFIIRTLLDLGYQVRFGVLQAGSFGTPQNRESIVYISSRGDESLPHLPFPTHQFPKSRNISLPTHQPAPSGNEHASYYVHPQLTVRDAISDLPGFHWEDPLLDNEMSMEPVDGLKTFKPDEDQLCGFHEVDYPSPPKSSYQQWIRNGSTKITHHTTVVYGDVMTSRVVNIPISLGADHRALPQRLAIPAYIGSTGSALKNRLYPGLFGRVDESAPFPTVTAVVSPLHRQGRCLHPTQRRILSVRECARAQGFSDCVDFISISNKDEDRIRIIGSAMPIPLGMAIARAIHSGVISSASEQRDGICHCNITN